jgi:hypothetical protein
MPRAAILYIASERVTVESSRPVFDCAAALSTEYTELLTRVRVGSTSWLCNHVVSEKIGGSVLYQLNATQHFQSKAKLVARKQGVWRGRLDTNPAHNSRKWCLHSASTVPSLGVMTKIMTSIVLSPKVTTSSSLDT